MKKIILLLLFIPLVFCCTPSDHDDSELKPFYLDTNGVTIKARDWVTVGTTGELSGVTYTAVDNTTLKEMADNDEDVTKVVTTLVADIKDLFKEKKEFNGDISSWDVSNVTSMNSMFRAAEAFNQDIGSWDVSKVEAGKMKNMFYAATLFNQDLTKWCVTNITTEPTDFNKNSALTAANFPKWGTCPSD
ncbi:MAG: BspA family leucine-rich repeat surface protein [Pelagibacteraceae bacterium]|jgi:surface protein|nr:BspA family leucine-rich repeat surface protein [Pelagibacteraceae bacterium]|tara:strand:- start:637 stop:1203 length:567 start_codon:yes stop_codon:yes gene_type:complete